MLTPSAPPTYPQPATAPAPPDANRRLRAAILSAARLLLGRGEPFAGDIVVKIAADAEGLEVRVKPTAELDGLGADANQMAAADAVLLARLEQMAQFLLSPDEQKLLRDLSENQPCTATSVQTRCKQVLSKSDFWAVWGQLQKRRLVEEGDDGRYRVGPDVVMKMLSGE